MPSSSLQIPCCRHAPSGGSIMPTALRISSSTRHRRISASLYHQRKFKAPVIVPRPSLMHPMNPMTRITWGSVLKKMLFPVSPHAPHNKEDRVLHNEHRKK